MNNQFSNRSKLILTALSLLLASGFQTAQAEDQDFIVNCKADCSPLIKKVHSLGGTITHKYENVNAISISLDSDYQSQLMAISPNAILTKDKIFTLPDPKGQVTVAEASSLQPLTGAALANFVENDLPEGFEFNNILTGASALNSAGFSGNGSVVALIDSGTANNDAVVATLAGSVIGGENFVPGAGEPSATSTLNGSHGTQTGTMIAGHAFFLLDSASVFAQSVSTHMPESVINDLIPGQSVLPVFGSAPDAKIYAMKVFPASGGGAPESRIIAAMDRAITLRTNYESGAPVTPINPGCGAEEDPCVFDSMNISVVNMSLGGGTLFAAGDLEDQLTAKMLAAGITLVASAGNDGFAAITGGSPGTGLGSLTVGAASTVGNERVLRDLQFGLGIGSLYRPSDHHQMATFSSRGPSSDGRISTDVVANGFACLVQGANGALNLVNGTSFSAPMVAGGAASLKSAFPAESALAIRNSLVEGANPNILGDGSVAIDQGAGFIDLVASFNLLSTGNIELHLPQGKSDEHLKKNVKSLGIKIIKPKEHNKTTKVSDLKPGQVAHFFIQSDEKTDQITISIKNIVASLAPADQNALFGDDINYVLQDAITHTQATIANGFITEDTEIVIDNPQTGLLRLAVMGDWTNAGEISADVVIKSNRSKLVEEAAEGRVDQSETQSSTFFVPDGTAQVAFELSWENNWGAYPTDDIDLILLDPTSATIFDGATFASPERVVIDNPAAGEWTAFIQGFTVQGVNEDHGSEWELRITDQDGKSLVEEEEDDDDGEDEDD